LSTSKANTRQYNDNRQECGFKNVIIANRMTAESQSTRQCPFVNEAEAESFQKHQYHAIHMWVLIHELLGHRTGKMLMEEPAGKYNFNIDNPPVNSWSEKPIVSWYKPGQTWTGQFEDLATTVDECRCELVGAYLMDDVELLALFGFDEDSIIRANDREFVR
jgi:dipeptidyl-peptidase-3